MDFPFHRQLTASSGCGEGLLERNDLTLIQRDVSSLVSYELVCQSGPRSPDLLQVNLLLCWSLMPFIRQEIDSSFGLNWGLIV